jgi:hypothetical protein
MKYTYKNHTAFSANTIIKFLQASKLTSLTYSPSRFPINYNCLACCIKITDRVQHIQSAPDKITPDLRWFQNQKCSHIFSSSRIQQKIFSWERRGWEKEPRCFPRWVKSLAVPTNMIKIDALTKSTADITARKDNLWIGRINVRFFI